jgi:hypothetical protein
MSEKRDEILDQLIKLRREFEKLCGHPVSEPADAKDLTLFGLTLEEAKDWIDNEPTFVPKRPPRGKLTPYPLGEGAVS